MTTKDEAFRRQALNELVRRPLQGDLLRITPAYTPWLFRGFLGSLAAAGLIVAFAKVGHYAEGQAVVHLERGLEPTARRAGPAVTVIGILPGRFRPQLHAGLPMQLELSGYENAHQDLTVDSTDLEVVDRRDAPHAPEMGGPGTVTQEGPVVLARGRVLSETFEYKGRTVAYQEGMRGTVRVRVGSDTVLQMLLHGLGGGEHG